MIRRLSLLAAVALLSAGCAGRAHHAAQASTAAGSPLATGSATAAPTTGPTAPGPSGSPRRVAGPVAVRSSARSGGAAAGLAVHPCAPGQLAGGIGGVQGATGHTRLDVTLRNVSVGRCLVYGYPTLTLLDAHGKPLPTQERHGSTAMSQDPGARPVTIAPGGFASFSVVYDDVAQTGPRECVNWRELAVVAPEQTQPLLVRPSSPPAPVCQNGTLTTTAVLSGGQGAPG